MGDGSCLSPKPESLHNVRIQPLIEQVLLNHHRHFVVIGNDAAECKGGPARLSVYRSESGYPQCGCEQSKESGENRFTKSHGVFMFRLTGRVWLEIAGPLRPFLDAEVLVEFDVLEECVWHCSIKKF